MRSNTIIVHMLFLAAFFYVPMFFLPDFSVKLNAEEVRWNLLVSNIFAVGIFYINYYLLIPKFIFRSNYTNYILYSIPLIAVSMSVPFLLNRFFFLSSLNHPDFLFGTFMIFTLSIVLAFALRFSEDWRRIREEIKATELMYLKKQINPHFFFNTLNGIYAMIIKKSPNAPKAVLLLSNLMRYVIYDSENNLVELEKEVKYVTDYIEMQKMRLSDNNHVSFSVNGDMENVHILPLVFIPFIENAFKYGISSEVESYILIHLKYKDNKIHFSCINDINENNISSFHSGLGISNSRKRLDMTYPKKYFLSAFATEGKYIVDLNINLAC